MTSAVTSAESGGNGGSAEQRRTVRFGVLAAVLCPCHLPLVVTLLAAVGFGGIAATLSDNLGIVSAVMIPLALGSAALAFRSYQRSVRCEPCDPPATNTAADSGPLIDASLR